MGPLVGSPRPSTCYAALSAIIPLVTDLFACFTNGAAAKGDPGYEYVWDDERYRFATVEHRDMFKALPDRYAPQYPGLCAMLLANGAKAGPDSKNRLVRDGRLYLFGNPSGGI